VTPVRIRPATPADIPALAAVLARAFARDPMVAWPMVSEGDLEARVRAHFEQVDGLFAVEGWMHRTEDGLGTMALVPPDSADAVRKIDETASAGMADLAPDGGTRYTQFWEWIGGVHPHERYWLLDQLAVDPPAQGRGLGTAMLRFAIGSSEADGLPLLLETGVGRNVPLYERFGFTVVHADDAPGGGPHVWFMRREPGR
jgi:ribosomal protein S18 acetylase RimI-like enzyme